MASSLTATPSRCTSIFVARRSNVTRTQHTGLLLAQNSHRSIHNNHKSAARLIVVPHASSSSSSSSSSAATPVSLVAPPATEPSMSIQDLKSVLTDSLWGTERGLSADSDTRAEVLELISQLEGRNPTPSPTEALDKLAGTWKLIYTSNSELIALLALGRLPLVTVGDVFQSIDSTTQTVENRIQLSAPFSRTQLAASATFDVRSPKLLQIEFIEGKVGTPELLADFDLPSTVDVLGQSVDLGAVKAALQPLDGPLKAAVGQLGSLLSGAPDLRFPINSPAPNASWLLTTYLDDDLRVSRGDGGSIFVLVKEKESESEEWSSGNGQVVAVVVPEDEEDGVVVGNVVNTPPVSFMPLEPDVVVIEDENIGDGSVNGSA